MGIVVPADRYRPLSRTGRIPVAATRARRSTTRPRSSRRPALALAEGFPGTALALGKDLWATAVRRKMAHAVELLDAAYEALGRSTLRRVLQTHVANRTLPSVDILDDEGGG